VSEQLTDADWKAIADRISAMAEEEAGRHYGVGVFVEVFDDAGTRYESRGASPPDGAETAGLKARIAELEAKLETTMQRAQWDLDWRIEAEALTRKLDTRIAGARAELEQALRWAAPAGSVAAHISRALEALE
jgi:hypothetical protein